MAKRKISVKKARKGDIAGFLLKSSQSSQKKLYNAAKVGIVTALIGGIFKAISLTETFPQPFDMLGNIILFIAFLMMFFGFFFAWFSG